MAKPSDAQVQLPCVVQIGFGGSRHVFEIPADFNGSIADLQEKARAKLIDVLSELPNQLGLGPHHFLCGHSQLAIGADTAFTRACRELNIPQRILLPQDRDAFLTAHGANAEADFTEPERRAALELFASHHIIEETVVSLAPDRGQRFEDANRAIARQSDVVILLLREGAKPSGLGGTHHLMKLTEDAGKPVLLIRASIKDDQPCFASEWKGRERFHPPELPVEIRSLPAPAPTPGNGFPLVTDFCKAVNARVSDQARRHSERFSRAALFIIAAHVVATFIATISLAERPLSPSSGHAGFRAVPHWIPLLTAAELGFLLAGLRAHHWIHHRRPSKYWAINRLLAEINRSVSSLGHAPMPLAYLFCLRLPGELMPLLRTLDVLHQLSARTRTKKPLADLMKQYLAVRLDDPKNGQIPYYKAKTKGAERMLRVTNTIFLFCAYLAIGCVAGELTEMLGIWTPSPSLGRWLPRLLGIGAIFLPVLAVGALSWTAAMDYEPRAQIFNEMRRFLDDQRHRIEAAASEREFFALVEETEIRLLGETADWFSRRTFPWVT